MMSVPNSIQLLWSRSGSSEPIIFADTGVKFVKNTRYRIKLVPIIDKAYASQYNATSGLFIYFWSLEDDRFKFIHTARFTTTRVCVQQ